MNIQVCTILYEWQNWYLSQGNLAPEIKLYMITTEQTHLFVNKYKTFK